MPGAQESGDLHVIQGFSGGLLIGVMDGLGHGPEAAVASRICASVLKGYSGEPLDAMVALCHERLHGSRGVALSICTLNEKSSTWSWIGVGNVSCVLLRNGAHPRGAREFLMQRNGVVGGFMHKPTVSTLPALPEDVMVLATDGIRTDFSYALNLAGTPQQVAERILDTHATGKDDALTLVARYTGGPQ